MKCPLVKNFARVSFKQFLLLPSFLPRSRSLRAISSSFFISALDQAFPPSTEFFEKRLLLVRIFERNTSASLRISHLRCSLIVPVEIVHVFGEDLWNFLQLPKSMVIKERYKQYLEASNP